MYFRQPPNVAEGRSATVAVRVERDTRSAIAIDCVCFASIWNVGSQQGIVNLPAPFGGTPPQGGTLNYRAPTIRSHRRV